MKVNVDAAINEERKVAGLGTVIRNSQGQVVAAAAKRIKFEGDVSIAEAKVVKRGMDVARAVSCTYVIIETDCRMVAELANNKVKNISEIWWIIAEILNSKGDFQSITFQHALRHCNMSTHSLTKRALQSSEFVIWRENFPTDVLCMLANPPA